MNKIKIKAKIDCTNEAHINAAYAFLQALGELPLLKENPVKKPRKKADTSSAERKTAVTTSTNEATTKKAEQSTTRQLQQSTQSVEENSPKETDGSGITVQDIRVAMSTKVANNKVAIKKELTRLEAHNVSALLPEHYQEFMDFLNSLD